MTTRSRETFKELVTLPDLGLPLAEAALLMACEEYPQLSLTPYLDELDRIAARVNLEIQRVSAPLETIDAMNHVLFTEYGFEGNSRDYYDPRNSFLNDVLERRKGIPITLSTIYIEVAHRIGFPMYGVGTPGHFVVKHVSQKEEIFVDPFNRGVVLTREDCCKLLLPGNVDSPRGEDFWLRRITNRQILTRMLANLKVIYINARIFDKAVGILDLMLLTEPRALRLYKERGLLHLQLRDFDAAARDLRRYLEDARQRPDHAEVEEYLRDVNRIRAMRN